MPITSPVAITFSNKKLRLAADLLAQLDNLAASVLAEWTALGGTALIPNTVGNVLRDAASPTDDVGTGGDGRPVVDGAKLNNIVNRLTALRSTSATTGLAMGVAGVRDTVLQVAVNTTRYSS
jgi:hypothetical protein